MTALGGSLAILAAFAMAGWMGYQIGLQDGIRKEQTKRGIRRYTR